MKIGSKVLYRGEIYYVRHFYDDNSVGLSQSIDGKPTLVAKKTDVRLI